MRLCDNCLDDYDEAATPPTKVGEPSGGATPTTATIELCAGCQAPLAAGDLVTFHERYETTKTFRRGARRRSPRPTPAAKPKQAAAADAKPDNP